MTDTDDSSSSADRETDKKVLKVGTFDRDQAAVAATDYCCYFVPCLYLPCFAPCLWTLFCAPIRLNK